MLAGDGVKPVAGVGEGTPKTLENYRNFADCGILLGWFHFVEWVALCRLAV